MEGLDRMENKFTHFNDKGEAIMVDVSDKIDSTRVAVAKGSIKLTRDIMKAVVAGAVKKGDVLGVARLAGIMATKNTAYQIPLCHILQLTNAEVDFRILEDENIIEVFCTVKTKGKTGVEMEALHGVSISLLTIYDMCKAIDKGMEIREIFLLEKSGGKSGFYKK